MRDMYNKYIVAQLPDIAGKYFSERIADGTMPYLHERPY